MEKVERALAITFVLSLIITQINISYFQYDFKLLISFYFVIFVVVFGFTEVTKIKPINVIQINPTLQPTNPTLKPTNPNLDSYSKITDSLVSDMLKYSLESSDLYSKLINTDRQNYALTVEKKLDHDFFYRVIADVEASKSSTFDFLADISTRKEWDEIVVDSGIVDVLSNQIKIQYLRTKSLFPTSGREALVVAITRSVDGMFLNVTSSIPSYKNFKSDENLVRMNAKIAGVLVMDHPSGDKNRCRVIQITDGNLNGWIPKSVVSMVTTQAFPLNFKRANKILLSRENKTESSLIKETLENFAREPVKEEDAVKEEDTQEVTEEAKQEMTIFQQMATTFRIIEPFVVVAIFIVVVWRNRRSR